MKMKVNKTQYYPIVQILKYKKIERSYSQKMLAIYKWILINKKES